MRFSSIERNIRKCFKAYLFTVESHVGRHFKNTCKKDHSKPCKRIKKRITDIDLVRAKSSKVIATVRVWLELEQSLVVRVVGGVLAQRGAGGRRLGGGSQHRLRVRHLLYLLEELRLSLDSVKTVLINIGISPTSLQQYRTLIFCYLLRMYVDVWC